MRQAQALALSASAAAAAMQATAHIARQKTLEFAALAHQRERETASAEDAKKRAVWEQAEAERVWWASRSALSRGAAWTSMIDSSNTSLVSVNLALC